MILSIHINDLAPEILDLIMRHAAEISMQEMTPSPSRTTFPFNAASVCTLWFDILKSLPNFPWLWQRVVFDVADDPAPLLDTFSFFNNPEETRDIVVFSSLKNDPDAGPSDDESNEDTLKTLENTRVHTIFNTFEPLIPLFANITFDVVYESSLPSASLFLSRSLPRLASLSLSCMKYDFDDEASEITRETKWVPDHPVTDCPSLRKLSLTGYAFMQLKYLDHDWYTRFQQQNLSNLELYVTHFKFHDPHRGESHNHTRQLDKFMGMLSISEYDISTIHLSDLSLSYYPKDEFGGEICSIFADNFIRDNVSRNFLRAFFNSSEIVARPNLVFKSCSMPHNAPSIDVWNYPASLTFENIPFRPPGSYTHNQPTSHSYPTDDSLYYALSEFCSEDIRFHNCDGVTDELLDWVGQRIPDPEGDVLVETLHIRDCTEFTSTGLRKFIQLRSTWDNESLGILPLREVKVSGKGPVLLEEDAAWFLNSQQSQTRVEWNVDTTHS